MSFSCADKDTLVAYVYGECDGATRAEVEAHLSACAACADEAGGFGAVRGALAGWVPPERSGGFRLVRDAEAEAPSPAKVLRPARWWQAPASALARVAAAVLLFAGGAALANLDVRYDRDGFAVRTGWQGREPAAAAREAAAAVRPAAQPAPQAEAAATPPAAAPSPAPWRVELASLERQLREDFRQQLAASRAGASPVLVSNDAGAAEDRMMARVRALVDESARRQQVETALHISQLERDFQAQRRADLVRVQQTIDQWDLSAPALPQQRQLLRLLPVVPVSLKK